MDLFDHRRAADVAARAPLADRLRPRTLDEFVGQEHIVGPGRLLRRAIEADQLSSVIFYGPPGTGKTTLARIVAGTTEAHFIALNAVLAGVKDIRASVAEAEERRGMQGQRTILFVDEVHRFNKAQQDALLPWVENGTVVLIGATTENPYFEVNKALVSRSRVFQLLPLEPEHLRAVARAALADEERGYGRSDVDLHDDALEHLIDVAGGDARGVLNALELAIETTDPTADGSIVIDLQVAEESIQRRAVLYDKEGDVHYDTVSAFIKSMRGSDPDATLYWLARMVYAGEDPRFIFRRMLIQASEDVGLADPRAVEVVVACARAFDYVGLPEGRFHLAQAALYLATAPKSNSTLAFFDALETVEKERAGEVPTHLKDGNRDSEGFGHGAGYLYPHAHREHWVAQQYLPSALQGRVFYDPSDQGHERDVRVQVQRRREAQLAAMLDETIPMSSEVLTFTGDTAGRDRDRWLARAVGDSGDRLAELRDRVIGAAALERHHLVLDLKATTGLLTWEAARRTPEGGVWSLAMSREQADTIEGAAVTASAVDRPAVIVGGVAELPDLLDLRGEGEVRFDACVGRNALAQEADRAGAVTAVHGLMALGGKLSLAESVPRRSSRPSSLVASRFVGVDLAEKLRSVEAIAYGRASEGDSNGNEGDGASGDGDGGGDCDGGASDGGDSDGGRGSDGDRDPTLSWDESDLRLWLEEAGFEGIRIELIEHQGTILVSAGLLERWFDGDAVYARRLSGCLEPDELSRVRSAFEAVRDKPMPWSSVTAYVFARKG